MAARAVEVNTAFVTMPLEARTEKMLGLTARMYGVTMELVGIILMNISLLFSFDRGGIKFWSGWRMEVAGRVGLVF